MEDKVDNTSQASGNTLSKERRTYVRSQYLFPGYDMGVALEVAKKIDTQGAGTLSEASLAMALGLSAKSSGFSLRIATARQFGLIERSGDNLYTTELAKGILRSIGQKEKEESLARSFYNVDLFRAIGDRFRGVPLPSDDDLRNLLEREFGVKRDRIGQAFSSLMNSAKIAEVLQESQGKVYLLREPVTKPPAPTIERVVEIPTGTRGVTININIQLQLPATEDATIYDSLFSALKKHLFS